MLYNYNSIYAKLNLKKIKNVLYPRPTRVQGTFRFSELPNPLVEGPTMKGTRPLDNNEIRIVAACFDSVFEARNRGLFMLGVLQTDVSPNC